MAFPLLSTFIRWKKHSENNFICFKTFEIVIFVVTQFRNENFKILSNLLMNGGKMA